MQRKYLLRKDPEDSRDYLFSEFLAGQKAQVLRDTDLSPKFPAIWDQLNLGACQSFAYLSVAYYLYFIRHGCFPAFGDPSFLFEYWNVRDADGTTDQDAGGTLLGSCKAGAKWGIAPATDWPYDISKLVSKPPQAAYDDAAQAGIKDATYHRVQSIDEVRQALSMGLPVYIGIKVYENFEAEKVMQSGIIPMPAGNILGGHALVIVGHHDNDEPSCKAAQFVEHVLIKRSAGNVKIRNSWGTGIGLQGTGYFRADFEVLEKLLMDMWVIVR